MTAQAVTSRTHSYPVVWVKLEAFCEIRGETAEAVRKRRQRGIWLDGRHTKVVDRHLYVNVPEADRWIEENGR